MTYTLNIHDSTKGLLDRDAFKRDVLHIIIMTIDIVFPTEFVYFYKNIEN